jgi:hypothetical protein
MGLTSVLRTQSLGNVVKIMRLLFYRVVSVAAVVLTVASVARADDCALATTAAFAQANVPHAVTHSMTAPGKPPARVEMIFTDGKAYTQISGAWNVIPYSAQQQIDVVSAASKRAEQTVHTCRKQSGELINGEAASLVIMHSEANGKASDARFWISDKTGLPLKSEVHLASGTVNTDDFRYDNIEAPHGAK